VLQLITILLAVFLLLCIARHAKIFFIFLISFCMLVSMFLVCLRYRDENQRCALVKKMNTKLYNGPSEQYAVMQTLPLGMELTINAQENSWCRVSNDSCSGWVHYCELDEIS
jgi:uncharacterized protein YgiM (DUF1202 family)